MWIGNENGTEMMVKLLTPALVGRLPGKTGGLKSIL